MNEIATLLARFVDDWHSGRRPSVEHFLEQAEPAERSELAAAISTFLEYAPTPAYDETVLADMYRAPPVIAAVEAFSAADHVAWPEIVGEWRRRAGLSPDALAERVLAAAGLRGQNPGRAAEYLYGFETGQRAPESASRRLLETLARVLGIPREDLGLQLSGALFRAESDRAATTGEQLEALADALATPAQRSVGEADPVDDLFFGG